MSKNICSVAVLEANPSCQCTIGAEVLPKSGPGYEKVR